MKNYEYPGSIHIHTKYSDGTESIEYIARQAKKSGLKWIIINDHNTLQGLKDGKEGYYDGVLVLIGTEISPEHCNHYLAFDVYEDISCDQKPEEYIKAVNDKGGFGFIAHPDEQEERENKYPALRWHDWSINGFQGLEIWNFMSDWVDTLSPKNKYKKFLSPYKSLRGPTPEVMKWWDNLNNRNCKIVPAIIGTDVHAFKYPFMGMKLTVFPYEKLFKTLQNNIQIDDFLSHNFETAKKQVYTALKNGNNIMVNNKLGTLEGTVFTATKEDENGKQIRSSVGEFLVIEDNFIIDIEIPSVCKIKLYKNGELIKEETTNHLKHRSTETGSYRFEAYKNGYHWILSNPIKVVNFDA